MSEAPSALAVDVYELSMLESYYRAGMRDRAAFDLFVRRLPRARNYLIAAGIDAALDYLEGLCFLPDEIEWLASTGLFSRALLDELAGFRFSGDVWAVPEGSVVFAGEPLLEVVAPLPEAQLVETVLLNRVQLGTLLASKAARVVDAAAGRPVLDFGLRRMHGEATGVAAARAFWIAGARATSNAQAARELRIPMAGTMAHSYVQAHASELEAFRRFARDHPGTTLLVDTYDTRGGVERVIELARELGPAFDVTAIRLDSGDLGRLAREARGRLDAAGLSRVQIFASSSLDEYAIRDLVAAGEPIDGFGVGTRMAVSEDAPSLDAVYKLVEYAGLPRAKLSPEKSNLPGRKQIFRRERAGRMEGDVIAARDERLDGRPLLLQVMASGRRTAEGRSDLSAARARAERERASLPPRIRALDPAEPRYPVFASDALRALQTRAQPRAR